MTLLESLRYRDTLKGDLAEMARPRGVPPLGGPPPIYDGHLFPPQILLADRHWSEASKFDGVSPIRVIVYSWVYSPNADLLVPDVLNRYFATELLGVCWSKWFNLRVDPGEKDEDSKFKFSALLTTWRICRAWILTVDEKELPVLESFR